ncbi:DUF4124 domain-containing protein [Aliikangiella coralliicola]|nr:DUF4124 domain-containing protein [Aliikangiella coralliicola]
MKFSAIFSLAMLLALASTTSVQSADQPQYMYKWKGSDGEIHYTERPPANIPFEKIRMAKKAKATKPAPVAKPAQSVKAPESDKYSAWKKENCKIATQNLDILENAGRIAQDDGQGGTRLMTDEEKQANIDKMTEQKNKYCSEVAEEQ